MKEYIERDLLIQQAEVIASFRKRFYMNKEYIKDAEFVTDWVKNIPAADVVEVVRCKDCKYWNHGDCYRQELTRPYDYCSYGALMDKEGA